jgi:hypothetical protein
MCQRLQAPDESHKNDALAESYLRSASVPFWNRANWLVVVIQAMAVYFLTRQG